MSPEQAARRVARILAGEKRYQVRGAMGTYTVYDADEDQHLKGTHENLFSAQVVCNMLNDNGSHWEPRTN